MPEIHELTIYYLNFVTLARALRNPTVKVEIREKRDMDSELFGQENDMLLGFLIYPVHQAADITIFNEDLVPVGEDQLPMIEQMREIVRKVNRYYGKGTVKEPRALLGDFPRIPGTNGRTKMSKTLRNCIYLKDSPETVKKNVMKMYTDPGRIHANIPGNVEGNPVFIYHDSFNSDKDEIAYFKEQYRKGKIGDREVKESLVKAINNFLLPIRKKRKYWEICPRVVLDLLYTYSSEARKIAQKVLRRIRSAMKF